MIGRNKALRRLIGTVTLLAVLFLGVQQVKETIALGPEPPSQQAPIPAVQDEESEAAVTVNDRLGIVFISSAEIARENSGTVPVFRYDRASSTGVHWNRWPFYWSDIETSNGQANYTWQDATVNSDYTRGIRINAILMNSPSWTTSSTAALDGTPPPQPRVGEGPRYLAPVPPGSAQASVSAASTTPSNLYLPVFSDGSDTPGPGKGINQGNYWARFVYNTVNRYKDRVKVWEMWNEPDHPFFWTGTVEDYYRLLKAGYLAAKHADPSSTVLMGGMAYYSNPGFFGQLLGLIKNDPTAAANTYYFDATAWHWYSRPSQMYDMVNATRNTMATYGLSKPIWVNETSVPIWNDPARPPFGGSNSPYFGSATQDEAASYVIQTIAYGLASNVQRIFDFQAYDDGNGEAFGLLRNDNSARPSFAAYQVAAQYLPNYAMVQKATDGDVEKIIFRGTPRGKVTVLWNKSPNERTYSLAATPGARQAYMVDKAGAITNLSVASSYLIFLPRATDNNGDSSQDYIIGGSPYLLVEDVPYTAFTANFPLITK